MDQNSRTAQFSPNYGCAIGVVALVVFSTLAALTVYTGYRQNKEIDKFASPAPLVFTPEFSSPERVAEVREQLRQFGENVSSGKAATLALSARDLNDLLGHEPKLFPIRDMIQFTEITETLNARISLPMRTILRGGKYRYLNGSASFRPVIENGRLGLEVPEMTSEQGQVPRGFVEIFSESNLLHPYLGDEKIAPILESITSVGIEGGRIRLEFAPRPQAEQTGDASN